MNETVYDIVGERASSPLNLVWNDVDPLGLDFDIRESTVPDNGAGLESDLLRLSSVEPSLKSSKILPNKDDQPSGGARRKKRPRSRTTGGQTAGTRTKKPNGKPKRPLTAKMCFLEELKTKAQSEQGHADFQALKMIAEEGWSRMRPEQRKLYEVREEADKARFREEMKNFTETKPKKLARLRRRHSPTPPNLSPPTTPLIEKAPVNDAMDFSQKSSSKSSFRSNNSVVASSGQVCERDTQARNPGRGVPSTYHNSRSADYPPDTNRMSPDNDRDFPVVSQPFQVLPATPRPPPPADSPPPRYPRHQYSTVDDHLFRAMPSIPMSSSHHHPHVQDPPQYLPPAPRARREQSGGTPPPALLRPRMEIELNGPDGLPRKYILNYTCISMKRDEVSAFMDSLNQHGGGFPSGPSPAERPMGPSSHSGPYQQGPPAPVSYSHSPPPYFYI